MIWPLLLALSATSVPPSTHAADPSLIRDASHAIEMGRLQEARLMIARAAGAGVRGPALERLMADLAFASGNFNDALGEYNHLVASGHKDGGVCANGAIAALKMGRVADAKPLADCATAAAGASWRAWNARGVLADLMKDWSAADQAFARARELAPEEPTVLNNEGWSLVLRGHWGSALPLLEQAAKLDPKSKRIADNLELARAATAAEVPKRGSDEPQRAWAERLNDAGVAAELNGDREKAVAAFTQALDASGVWYDRAANNLEAVSAK
jgi:Flp pilus assembly protein TadD